MIWPFEINGGSARGALSSSETGKRRAQFLPWYFHRGGISGGEWAHPL